ncbi:MAG: T9SS type A sorting domain-containing protein [Flavobacteriales bacterium]
MRTIFLSVCTVAALTLTAQSWCPPGAVWYYDASFCMGGCHGYVCMKEAGDTILQDQSCSRIERTRAYTALGDPEVRLDTLTELYTYSDAGIVWMFDPELNAFDTLYNLNAIPGDTWQLIHLPGPITSDAYLTVLDTGTIHINALPLRWLSVEHHYPGAGPNDHLDTLIERIGSIVSYMLPYDFPNGFVDGQEGGTFRCYRDEAFPTFSVVDGPCDLSLEIAQHPHTRNHLQLLTNPITTDLIVDLPAEAMGRSALLLDASGRMLRQVSITEQRFHWSLDDLSSGTYILWVVLPDGPQQVRVVKL